MPTNTARFQSANEQVMTLNFLVMKHICETLLPSHLPNSALADQTLMEVLGTDHEIDDKDHKFEDYEGRFIKIFLGAIGFDANEEDGEISVIRPLPNPPFSEVVSRFDTWWRTYSSTCKDQSIVYSPMDSIFACYGEKSHGTHSDYDFTYECFDKLISAICGETFTSVWERIRSNPFIDYVAPGKRPNAYSVDVMLFKKDTYCNYSDTSFPAENFYLQMQLVTANPAVIGSNLHRLVGLIATSLVKGGFSSSHCVTDLVICKNGQRFIKLPVSLKPLKDNGAEFHESFEENNKEWRLGYELDFSRLEVIRSNEFLIKSISNALPEKDRFSFLGSHFSADLGV